MDFDRLCALLGDVDIHHLREGFSSLLGLFPNSSCETIQLVNVLIPLVLDVLHTFYNDHTMVQMNLYLYAQVYLYSFFACFKYYSSFLVMPWTLITVFMFLPRHVILFADSFPLSWAWLSGLLKLLPLVFLLKFNIIFPAWWSF